MAYNKNIPYNELSDLPPASFNESAEMLKQLAKAYRYLGELNGLCSSMPDSQLLIKTILGTEEGKPGATIKKKIDLIARGLAWQKDIKKEMAFGEMVEEIKTYL